MKFRTGAKAVAALMFGAGLTLATPMLPAVGQSSPAFTGVRLSSPGKIAARGAVVFQPVLVSCPAGDTPGLSVQLTERSGNGIAQGFGSIQVDCTGGIQQVTVAVVPSNKPFVPGVAFGQAQLFDCNPIFGCSSATDQRSVKLVTKK